MGRSNKNAINKYTADKYRDGGDPWKRQRKERTDQPSNFPSVDVHGILFAVVAVVFVVYPLMQWALGR